MIWPNSVSYALFTLIASDQTLVNSGVSVELHEPFCTDPNRMPWAGVYLNNVGIDPHTVNRTRPWEVTYDMSVFCRAHSYKRSGQEAADLAQRLVTPVMTAINSNRSLGIDGLMLTAMTVAPFERNLTEEDAQFSDEINLIFRVLG